MNIEILPKNDIEDFQFEQQKEDPEDELKRYLDIVENMFEEDLYLGRGMSAIVCKIKEGNPNLCSKIIWRELELELSANMTGFLPEEEPVAIFGKSTYNLFKVKNQMRSIDMLNKIEKVEKNKVMIPDVYPVEEQRKQNEAKEILKNSGINCYVPKIHGVEIINREPRTVEKSGFSCKIIENYYSIIMERIYGQSIEDFILNYREGSFESDLIVPTVIDDNLDNEKKHHLQNLNNKKIAITRTFIENIRKGILELHRNNILHQDLTLRNIMINFNNPEVPVIIDFGKSKPNNIFANKTPEKEMEDLNKVLATFSNFLNNPELEKQKLQHNKINI